MNEAVVKVYSEALSSLSCQKKKWDTYKKDIHYVQKIFIENNNLMFFLINPNIDKNNKKNLIREIFENIDIDIKNFIFVLIDKSRIMLFEDIVNDFYKKYNEKNNILEGIVYSASVLDEIDIKKLEKTLENKFSKRVELENIIDESIIGGVSIFIDGKKIDNSIRNRLDKMRAHLMKEGINR